MRFFDNKQGYLISYDFQLQFWRENLETTSKANTKGKFLVDLGGIIKCISMPNLILSHTRSYTAQIPVYLERYFYSRVR